MEKIGEIWSNLLVLVNNPFCYILGYLELFMHLPEDPDNNKKIVSKHKKIVSTSSESSLLAACGPSKIPSILAELRRRRLLSIHYLMFFTYSSNAVCHLAFLNHSCVSSA